MPEPAAAQRPRKLTLYDMLRGDRFLLGFVADLVGLGGDEVDEFSAAVDHQLPGVVRHADVGQRLFDHLVDGSPGDGEVVVVAGRRGHPGWAGLTGCAQRPSGAPGRGDPAGAGGAAGSDGEEGRGTAGAGPGVAAGPGSAARAQGSLGRGACHCRLRHILRPPAPLP